MEYISREIIKTMEIIGVRLGISTRRHTGNMNPGTFTPTEKQRLTASNFYVLTICDNNEPGLYSVG